MASVIPAFVRTWQIADDIVCVGNATLLTQFQTLMLEIKNRMKGLGTGWKGTDGVAIGSVTGGCTVVSSCNGVAFGNNDNVDRWTTIADLVSAIAGNAHAWCVLQLAGIGSTFQILLELSGSASIFNITVKVSHTGFGAARGGVDGTLLLAPTALNSQTLLAGASSGAPSAVSTQTLLNVWLATDGKGLRLAAFRGGKNVMLTFFDLPILPETGWTTPYSASWNGSPTTGDAVSTTTLTNGTLIKGWGTAAVDELLTIELAAGTALYLLITQPNSFTGNFPFWGIGIYSATVGNLGRLGVLPDFYLGLAIANTGDTYPGAAPFDQLLHVCGPFMWPWCRTVPVTA